MRYPVLIVLAAGALFFLLGRSGGDTEEDMPVLEFWCYGTGGATNPAAPFWETVAQRFMALNPGVRVKTVSDIPHGPYISVLTTRFIGGNPPDVMAMDDTHVGLLAHEGLLAPLEDFIRGDPAYFAEDYPPSMVRDGYLGDVRYSVPYCGGFSCLYYRTDVFARVGVEPPQTWDELLRVCRTLQEKAGIAYPFGFSPKAAFWMMPWVWQNGGRILTADYRTVAIDTPEFIQAVQFVHDLMYRHRVADPALARGAKLTDLWGTGAAAIVIDGSWYLGRYDEIYPQWRGKWAVAPLPAGRESVSFFGGLHLVMSKQTEHPDLAWSFMSFAASLDNQILYAEMTGDPPANLKAYAMPGFLELHPYYGIVPKVIEHGRNNEFAPFYKKIWYDLFQNKVLDVVMSEPDADIPKAVRETAREMQAVANDYWATHDYFVQGYPAP